MQDLLYIFLEQSQWVWLFSTSRILLTKKNKFYCHAQQVGWLEKRGPASDSVI